MLPELFSVGNTMQEDFGFLNVNNCYAEKTTASHTRDSIDRESPTSSIFNKTTTKIKLEDSPDINKWSFNYGANFLRTSDDPLISSVNNGCEQVDNELLRRDSTCTETTSTLFDNMNNTTKSRKIESTEITTHVKRVTTRTRRKGPLKLRFHHQALPPEYLNHYESQQQLQENLRHKQQQNHHHQQPQSVLKKTQTKTSTPKMPTPPVAAVPIEKSKSNQNIKKNNENIINWLQNVLDIQNKQSTKSVPKTRNIPIEVISSPAKTQCLSDLPYMGEMTLENMKPRRGRKPKKADICHLIYKNYGTVIPGSNQSNSTVSVKTATNEKKSSETTTTSTKKKSATVSVKKLSEVKNVKSTKVSQNEPLNLCVREKKEDLSILISDDNESNDIQMPKHNKCKTLIEPCESNSIDLEFSSTTIPSLISPLDLTSDMPSTKSPPPASSSSASTPVSPGYVYWPSAGIFIHPMAFYYQKMMNSNKLNHDSSESSSTSSLSSMMNQDTSTLWDQNLSPSSIDMKVHDFDIKSEEGLSSPPVLSEMLRNTTLDSSKDSNSCSQSQKRKRSAIFIPPVQIDNSTSPTNEVSICKFKFTGGAKPSLQEKKILSVDSGGNFRYYSGTGDKNMRGYEFFPRENLMQSSLSSSSHTNAFLNAESEKIPLELLPPIPSDLNSKLLNLSPEIVESTKTFDSNLFPNIDVEKSSDIERQHRKKKTSNRSVQRAKLEKTFKEKGFLIQTQQLESAEGATYCKFRQLKKFTRYLFRSWKDYLPMEEGMPIPADCHLYPNNIHETNNSSNNNINESNSSP